VLYTVLDKLGVVTSVNTLVREVGSTTTPVLSLSRALTAAVILAAIEVVLLTLLATLGALLYNLCASFTGGIEVQLGDRDAG